MKGSSAGYAALCGAFVWLMALSPLPAFPNALDGPRYNRFMKLPRITDWPRGEADLLVSRSPLSVETEEAIERLLRFDNPEFFKAQNSGQDTEDVERYIRAYRQYPNAYRLPRHAPFQKLGLHPPHVRFPDTDTLPWKFTGTLRDEQVPAFAAIQHQLIYRKDGILILGCGKGKTVLAAAAFGWQRRPALAIVTQLFIGEQWRKALLQFTDIPEERIGWIGDGSSEWDRDFVIATIQTLAQKDFPWKFYRRFGMVFYDECHRLGARHFSKVAPMFTGQRMGLTATLQRSDKMEQLFMLHLGRVFYEDRKQQLIPRIYFRRTNAKKNVKGFRWRSPNLNIAKVISHLSKMDYRQEWIIELFADALSKQRKVLFLSERKSELVALHKQLKGRGIRSGICVGSLNGKTLSQATRAKALRQPITLATSQLVKEGLDKREIDTLIIGYPQSSEGFTEQSAGRILRLDDEKRPPVVVVLVDAGVYDTHPEDMPFVTKARRMEQTFRKLGYTIVEGVDEAVAAA